MIPYDVWRLVKVTKGFRHTCYKTVCRRIQKLQQQGWLTKKGQRVTKSSGSSQFYELTLRAKAALELDRKDIEEYLQTASDEQLIKFIEVFNESYSAVHLFK